MNAPLHSRLGKCCISFFFFNFTPRYHLQSKWDVQSQFLLGFPDLLHLFLMVLGNEEGPDSYFMMMMFISLFLMSGYCWWTLPVTHWAAGELLATMAFSTDLKSNLEAFAASLRTTNLVAGSTASACYAGNPIWVPVTLEYFIKHPWNQTPSLLPVKEIQHPQMMGFSSSLDPKTKSSSHFWDNPI